MSKGFASNYRVVLLATGIFLGFGGVAVRLVWLHVIARDELLKYLEQARRSFVVENARRGNIRAWPTTRPRISPRSRSSPPRRMYWS